MRSTYYESDRVFWWEDGRPFTPDHISRRFPKLLKEHGMPHIRFHELRHPYVKLTTKKYICKSRNPKLPLPITWGFCFLHFLYCIFILKMQMNVCHFHMLFSYELANSILTFFGSWRKTRITGTMRLTIRLSVLSLPAYNVEPDQDGQSNCECTLGAFGNL